jgi:hypothetical protein
VVYADRVLSYRDKGSNLYNGKGGWLCEARDRVMSGRKRREVKKNGKAEEEDVQERKAAKKTKTSSSESFTIRGSWEGM